MPSLKWLYFFLTIAFAYFASAVFIPVLLSIFIAILLEPLVSRLVQRNISRHFASFIVLIAFLAISAFLGWLAYLSVLNLLRPSTSEGHVVIQKVQMVDPFPAWTHYLIRGVGSFYEVITLALFVPLLLFFLLYDKENLVESFNSIAGKHFYLPTLNTELPKMIRAFVTANVVTMIILSITHGFSLYFFGFQNWLPLALITAIISLLPLIGAPLAILLALAQGTVPGDSTYPFLLMAISFVALHLVATNILLPYLTGSQINVNSSALVIGLLFWGWLWGAMGFLLAVPMTALMKIFLESNPETIPLANLLAAKPNPILPGKRK